VLFSLLYWQKSKDNRRVTGSLVLIKRRDDDIITPKSRCFASDKPNLACFPKVLRWAGKAR
jgi:hypothetical protein